jgi:hypothetical protein
LAAQLTELEVELRFSKRSILPFRFCQLRDQDIAMRLLIDR